MYWDDHLYNELALAPSVLRRSEGGGGEIRTHGPVRGSAFQERRDRPLCHSSMNLSQLPGDTLEATNVFRVVRPYNSEIITYFIKVFKLY